MEEPSVQPTNEQHGVFAPCQIFAIDREMLSCKLIFFFHNAGFKCLNSFKSLYYLSFGIGIDKVGLSSSIVGISQLLWFPLWGMLIDFISKRRQTFITVVVLLATFTNFSIPWLLQAIAEHEIITICTNTTNATLRHNSTCISKVKLVNSDTFFYAITLIGAVCSVCTIGEISYRDTAVIKVTYTRSKLHNIGEQRTLAPLGMAIGTLIAGFAIDHYHHRHHSPYLVAFYIYVPLSLLGLPFLFDITKKADWSYGTTVVATGASKAIAIGRDIASVAGSTENVVFLASIFVFGYGADTYSHFLYIYMHKEMRKPSKTIMAVSSAIGTLSEMVALKFSMRMIHLVGGRKRCVSLVIFSASLRLMMLSLCTKPLHVVLLQPLSGIEKALGTTAMLEHIWVIFPKSVTTSGLSVFHILHWILAAPAVDALGGWIYHNFGGVILFRSVAMLTLLWSVITLVVFKMSSRRVQITDENHTNNATDNGNRI